MTRNEFIEDVTTWSQLIEICCDYESDVCEDIVSYDAMSAGIESELRDMVESGEYSWTYIRDALNCIDEHSDYYRRDYTLEYAPMNEYDNFDAYKREFASWMDDNEYWDEEQQEEEEQLDDQPVDDEDFSIGELMEMCSTQFFNIQRTAVQQAERNNEELKQWIEEAKAGCSDPVHMERVAG